MDGCIEGGVTGADGFSKEQQEEQGKGKQQEGIVVESLHEVQMKQAVQCPLGAATRTFQSGSHQKRTAGKEGGSGRIVGEIEDACQQDDDTAEEDRPQADGQEWFVVCFHVQVVASVVGLICRSKVSGLQRKSYNSHP